MANSGATLVVQRELLPAQSSSTSLSAFPSLLGTGEDGEEDGDRGELDDKGVVERGEEVVLGMVTSSMAAQGEHPEQPDHPYQCLDCGKSFKWSSRLTHHQRSHTDERPYRCNLCPKAFKGSSALLYHQRSHSGEKPYKCQDCGKAFKRSSLLQVHQSVHTGLRTFLCPYCALTFKWSSHYQYHLRQHTGECPYLCDSCPKAFKNSSSLRRHKNVHLGLKPYVCTVCNKAFTQSTNLRQHMRIHTGERPYVCKECGRSFTHSSNLALHKNSHANSVTSAVNGEERHAGNNPDVEVVVGSEEEASSLLSDIVGFVSQEGTVGVGVEEVFLSTTTQGQSQSLLPQLSFTSSGGGMCSSRAIGTELHLSTDTGASVLLYSCGSCNQTFSTRTELEDHQSIHMGSGGDQVAGGEAGGEAGMDVGVGHLLADFEEVVETTTVAENGHSAEELLGLTGGNDGTNVGTSQAQFDLLQSFTEVTQSSGGLPAARSSESGLQCGYCNKSFKTSGGLNRHVSLIHSLSSQSRSQFSCSACDRSFPLLTSLLTHQHSHTPEQRLLAEAEAEIVCPPSLSLSLPMPSSPSQAEKQPEEEEGQTEVHVNLIRMGEGEQQPTKPARVTRKGGANKNIAAGDRPYRCSECGKAFKGSSGLRYHMRDHTGERPYRCTECGKSFKRSSLLSIHQRVHTGVRAFQCPHCPLTFKWSSHYQYHLRQHTGERPYVCKECGKSFKNTSCLRRHSQMHSGLRPHTCSICSKSFSQTSNLKQHERTHSGERPFQCTHCSKSFTHSSNLQLHLRTHSSRKDFKCPYCSKEFVMHSYLQRHIRTHGNGTTLLCTEPQGKEASGAGQGVTTTTTTTTTTMTTSTLLNPITLETTGSSGSLIVSQPALDIPPNTSQNYFMIQTARGLQLIPLSAPTPTPPPPPPPPQTQNYVLLQCPSTGGSQGNLILVPTASNAPPAREAEALPLVQTVMGFQSVVSPARLPHFQTVSPQQQQNKFILSNTLNNSNNHGNTPVAVPTHPLSSNSLLSRPILGRSTRTARGRRGRKPKAALQKAAPPVPGAATVSNLTRPTPPTVTDAAAGPNSAAAPSSLAASAGSSSTSPAFAPSSSTSAAVTTPTSDPQSMASGLVQSPSGNPSTLPLLSSAAMSGEPPAALEELRTDESVSGKQLVLCFENEGERKEGASVKVGHGESFVLQFAREGSGETGEGGGVSGQGKSFVLRFNANGESGVDEPGDKSEVVSLLEGWGAEREGERPSGEGGGQNEPFVLHFQTEQQDGSPSNTAYSQGLNNSLNVSCTPTQDLVPLNGQEVVFELGEETKLGQDSGGSMQMITLIQGGGEEGSCGGAGGDGQEGRGTMESIYQLEGGEGIVIIEVSTSSLSEEQMERGGEREPTEKVGSETTEMKEQSEKVVNSTNHNEGDRGLT